MYELERAGNGEQGVTRESFLHQSEILKEGGMQRNRQFSVGCIPVASTELGLTALVPFQCIIQLVTRVSGTVFPFHKQTEWFQFSYT
jgi:hypothetical protein